MTNFITMQEIYKNAERAVYSRSKKQSDIFRQMEIDYATKQRKFYESELFFGALGYATAVITFIYCLIM